MVSKSDPTLVSAHLDAASRSRDSYTRKVPGVTVLSALDALRMSEGGLILVDVRSTEEVAVSRINGALTQVEFEARYPTAGDIPDGACVAAYCTIGYRSGIYARDHLLKGPRALPHNRVFNHEGIMLHTFTGEPLVRQKRRRSDGLEAAASMITATAKTSSVPNSAGVAAASNGAPSTASDGDWEATTEVHAYAYPWRGMAHPAFRVRYFGLRGLLNNGLGDNCAIM